MLMKDRHSATPISKIGEIETTAEFLKRRAGIATGDALLEILRRVPDRAPDAGDEIPESYRKTQK